VTGDIDGGNAAHLCSELNALITAGPINHVVVDLARVEFCDVAGMRALLEAHRRATTGGATCQVVHLSPAVGWLLRVTQATELLDPDG